MEHLTRRSFFGLIAGALVARPVVRTYVELPPGHYGATLNGRLFTVYPSAQGRMHVWDSHRIIRTAATWEDFDAHHRALLTPVTVTDVTDMRWEYPD